MLFVSVYFLLYFSTIIPSSFLLFYYLLFDVHKLEQNEMRGVPLTWRLILEREPDLLLMMMVNYGTLLRSNSMRRMQK